MLDVLIILAQRKRFIFSCTAIAALLSAAITFLLPKSYTATVVLLPPQQSSSISSALSSQLGNLAGMATLAGSSVGLKNANDMYVAILSSRTIEDAMIDRYGLMKEYRSRYISDARHALQKHATIDGSGKDGLIRISIEDHDPNRAAELANGYVEQYRLLSQHLAVGEAAQRRAFFQQQLESAKDQLAQAEESLKQTEQQTGLIQLDSQARALIESAASLRAQIAAKEVQIQSLQTFATNENAQIIQARQELESLRQQATRLAGLGANDDGIIVPRGKVTGAGLEYISKLRDVKYYETIFEILARQYEAAKVDEARQGATIQVVDSAIPPDKRSSPKRVRIVLAVMLLAFTVSNLLVLAQDAMRNAQSDAISGRKLQTLRAALSFRKR